MNIHRVVLSLKRDEAFSGTVYLDSDGLETIGYGFEVDAGRRGRLPIEIADQWLSLLVARLARDLPLHLPFYSALPEHTQDALTEMAYQLGIDGLLEFHVMIAALRVGNLHSASAAALDSRWAREVPERAARTAFLLSHAYADAVGHDAMPHTSSAGPRS